MTEYRSNTSRRRILTLGAAALTAGVAGFPGTPFGHSGNPSVEKDRAYAKLLGPEPGELKPKQ